MDGMIVPAVVISKVPWIEARNAADVAAVELRFRAGAKRVPDGPAHQPSDEERV
jgi:hypothetical protein